MTERKNYTQIMGTELEWAVSVKLEGENHYIQLDTLQDIGHIGMLCNEYLPEGIVRVVGSLTGGSGMMSNGSRYYQDVGGHMEYATPENISPQGVLLSELAGERVLAEALRNFVAYQEGVEVGLLRKRVIDDNSSLWGYHINISESRRDFFEYEKTIQPLTIHYASSLPLFGAGAVIMDRAYVLGEKQVTYKYSHGQKAVGLSSDFAHGTTNGAKPIINLRDEPHASFFEHRRIHIVGNDPHISPWATRMAIGTYSLLLIACRQKKLPLIEPEGHAYLMARRATYDIEGKNAYDVVVDGITKKYSANDIQKIYIESIMRIDELNPEQQKDLEQWQHAINDYEKDQMLLKDRSDSIAKLSLIRANLDRRNTKNDSFDNESAAIDKEYTTIMRATKQNALTHDVKALTGQSIPGKLRLKWFANDMPPENEISNAVINPPHNTRAYTRGRAILSGKVTQADWQTYSVGDYITSLEPLQGAKRITQPRD